MNTEQFDIIKAFSTGIGVDLTINQISKIIKKSYASTNKYTHELIEQGVLKKKVVGSAILCTLNYSSNKTIACLVFLSISDANNNSMEHENISSLVFRYNNKKYSVSSKNEVSGTKNLSWEDFFELITTMDLSKVEIMNNPEIFWRAISKVMKK